MHLRPFRALREVNRTLTEQLHAERAAEEEARFEIARSATRFSRRSKEVVDGTINLSAVLMRAGEVDEANRLLAEAEREVRSEEAVLIETVKDVRAEGLERRSRITRLKLLRMVATAFLGGSLMVASAFGVAVAKFLTEDPSTAGAHESDRAGAANRSRFSAGHIRAARAVLVPGTKMRVALTDEQLSEYRRLKNRSDIAPEDLRDFLLGLAPDELVNRVAAALADASEAASTKVSKATSQVTQVVEKVKEEAPKPSAPSHSPSAEPSETPEDDDSTPTPPTPPSEEEDSEGSEGGGKEGDKDDGNNSMFPTPLPPVSPPADEN